LNIIIVGGGAAGWLTSLYAKKAYPNENIVLIESDEIGILGAGEGTVPLLNDFFKFLDISTPDLIKNCNATIKNGIKFTNWSNKKDSYIHSFWHLDSGYQNNANSFFSAYGIDPYLEANTSFSHIISSKFNHKNEEYSFIENISNKNLLPIIEDTTKFGYDKFVKLSHFAYHFDANLLAKYLRSVAESRGVKRIEGIVSNIKTNKNNDIEYLLVNDKKIKSDFVFDCTGFKRLIIGNFYKSKWKSHSQHLPVKRAIPFFLPMDKEIPPYTEAIAMNYGWMWKIPVQNRYGCGYVFDSDFISDDEAKKEIDEHLGFEVESPRTFSFNAGCYEEIWINNCLAVGLSAGFIEPLEATSLMQSATVLKDFFKSYNNISSKNSLIKKRFNEVYLQDTEEIVDFLYLHYITNKKNNIFWKEFTEKNKIPNFIEYIFKILNDRPLESEFDFKNKRIFSPASYFYIMTGNKLLNNAVFKKYLNLIKTDKIENYKKLLKDQEKMSSMVVSHNYFLNEAKNV
jgi:tryptophan halogenase